MKPNNNARTKNEHRPRLKPVISGSPDTDQRVGRDYYEESGAAYFRHVVGLNLG
jgi:hypothetical protein